MDMSLKQKTYAYPTELDYLILASYLEPFSKMNSGPIIKKIKKEILYIHSRHHDLLEVYGFGSFFRSEEANDCDLLLVVSNDSVDLGRLHAELSKSFLLLSDKLSLPFDLTILTEREHQRKPLREHDILIPISKNGLKKT
jgi:predicted nucleotidyltransferase